MHIQIRPVMAAPPWHYHALFSTSLTIIIVAPIYHQPADYDLSFSKLSFCTKTNCFASKALLPNLSPKVPRLGSLWLEIRLSSPTVNDSLSCATHVQCHIMTCHVMTCHDMSCHDMSCHVMSCNVPTDDVMYGTLCGTSNLSTVLCNWDEMDVIRRL